MSTHDLPTTAGSGPDLARQLARLVGPAVQAGDGTVAAQEYLALGGGLATARQTTLDAISEAFPQTARDTLSEWERMLRVPIRSGASTADRRAAILARLRASGGSPRRIKAACGALVPSGVGLTEYTVSQVTAHPRMVFRFAAVGVGATAYADTERRGELEDVLQRAAPAHTTWNLTSGGAFRFDTAGAGFDVAPLT